jgi:uncharacterized protein YbaR (Trm112 family)
MQFLLTDRLTCPRCGPTFGLILLANELVERRVRDGVLGCPNCRDSFRIDEGFADLRSPPRGDLSPGRAGPYDSASDEEATRIVALLGIHRGPGTVATVGRAARFAAPLAAAVEDLIVAAIDADTQAWPERRGVSRMVSSPGLPFFGRMLRGVVVDGALGKGVLFEAARVTAPFSRVVVVQASSESSAVLEEAGLGILAAEGETVVAARG